MNDRRQQFDNDIEDLGNMVESELGKIIPNGRLPQVVPLKPATKLSYVQHHPDVDDVGRLSSEALAMSFEESAKRIEAMGESLKAEMREVEKATMTMVKESERVKAETEEAVKECAAAAEVYRGQAKELFEKIQQRSMLAAEVRKAASEMASKVRGEG